MNTWWFFVFFSSFVSLVPNLCNRLSCFLSAVYRSAIRITIVSPSTFSVSTKSGENKESLECLTKKKKEKETKHIAVVSNYSAFFTHFSFKSFSFSCFHFFLFPFIIFFATLKWILISSRQMIWKFSVCLYVSVMCITIFVYFAKPIW